MKRLGHALHAHLAHACGVYGRACVRRGYLFAVAGIVLAVVLSAGIHRIEQMRDVSELWVERGTRLERERNFYRTKFDGLDRAEVVSVTSPTSSSNAATPDALAALLHASRLALADPATDPLALSLPVAQPGAPLAPHDFCATQPVPDLFRPTSRNGVSVSGSYYSYGYARVTICMADSGALVDPRTRRAVAPLAEEWGIVRFPCLRTSVLDCFREGGFDYPREMRELARVAPAVLAARDGDGPARVAYTECLAEFEAEMARILEQVSSDPQSVLELLVDTMDEFLVPALATWGYDWRPRLEDLSEAEVLAVLDEAVRNDRNASLEAVDCAREGRACCLNWSGAKVDFQLFVGGLVFDGPNGSLTAVEALRTGWTNVNPSDSALSAKLSSLGITTEAAREDVINQWEGLLIDNFNPLFKRESNSLFGDGEQFSNVKLDFLMQRSTNDIVAEGNQTPVGQLVGAYLILLFYVFVSFFPFTWPITSSNFVESRVLLAAAGLLVISLATVSGFGLLAWASVAISPIALNLLPFLSLGVGLDDMFVIIHSLLGEAVSEDPEEKMYNGISASGPSVLLTSTANICAFLIASAVRIPALYSFCYQVAATLAINLILLFLLFIPLCAFDSRRARLGYLECWPFGKATRETKESREQRIAESTSRRRTLRSFAADVLGPKVLFRNLATKIIVVAAFGAFFVGMLVAAVLTSDIGLPLEEVAFDGTYQKSYVEVQTEYFTAFPSMLVSTEKVKEYESEAVQQAMLDQQIAIQRADSVSGSPAIWDTSFFANSSFSLLAFHNGLENLSINQPVPSGEYYKSFGSWALTAGVAFEGDVWCFGVDGSPDQRVSCGRDGLDPITGDDTAEAMVRLGATQQIFIQNGLVTTQDYVNAIRAARRAADGSSVNGLDAFVYGFVYEFWEQYVNIWRNFYRVVGFAILGVFIVSLLFTVSLKMSLLMMAVIVAVEVELFGLMSLIGVRLNAISLTNYAIAIGLSVEFTAHYSHAFLSSRGPDKTERAKAALTRMFTPGVNGMVSTGLSLIVVLASEFTFVRTYYFAMLFSMVVLAFLNGLVLLPVLASWIGPPSLEDEAPAENAELDASGNEEEMSSDRVASG